MSFALGLVLAAAQFGQGAGFADLDAVDREVAAFTGAPIGAPGGASMPVDRRLRLQACAAPLAVSWNGLRRDSVQVQCPAAGGWRIFVSLTTGAMVGAMAEDPVAWRRDPQVLRLCTQLTWPLAVPCVLRVLVQGPVYLAGKAAEDADTYVAVLGVLKVAMGWPLQIGALAFMVWLLSRDRTPVVEPG